MKLPVQWLADYIDVTAIGVERLADVLTMAGLEVEETTDSPAGPVFVTKVTPNRGDWLSIQGVAREASAAFVAHGGISTKAESRLSFAPSSAEPTVIPIRIDASAACTRYAARVVEIDHPGMAPAWMQERLAAAGVRSINAVVDVTNYIMIDLGQPLHAFDIDKLVGPEIIVRFAREGETITTLDGKKRELATDILVIADGEKPSAIAGIMGGQLSEVTESTRRIMIESANFNPMVVRAAAKCLGLSTDASYRFERHVDPELVPHALDAAAQLIADMTGGRMLRGMTDVYPTPPMPVRIGFRTTRAENMLGIPLRNDKPFGALKQLGFSWESSTRDGIDLEVNVPTHRADITREIDIIEELGRMVGYENLPETLPPSRSAHGGHDSEQGLLQSRIRSILVGQGLTEIFTHTLSAPSAFDDPHAAEQRVRIRTALSAELSGLRQSLIPNLLDTLSRNARLRNSDINLFEVGKVFRISPTGEYAETLRVAAAIHADYPGAKGILENLLSALRVGNAQYAAAPRHGMHSNRSAAATVGGAQVAWVAEGDPDLLAEHLDLPVGFGRVACFEVDLAALTPHIGSSPRYYPLLRFPEVTRDLAMVFDTTAPYGEIEQVARRAAGEYLESVKLLSVYAGERVESGKKSVALRLTLRAESRTLTDQDADSATGAVEMALAEQLGGVKR